MAEALPEYPDSDFSDEDLTPLDINFSKCADHIKKITNKLGNNQLLELYGLYKQGTEGKCNIPKPGWFDARGRKKWESWNSLDKMPSEIAKEKYIDLVQKYDPDWSVISDKKGDPKETWVAVSSMQFAPEPDLVHNELSLLEAAREDCSDRVKDLLNKNPELRHETDDDGLTALHWAADRNATKALEAALQGGCIIDAVDECGQTALHYAASCGHIESTKILVKAGASFTKDEDGNTPLDLATDGEIRKFLEGAQ